LIILTTIISASSNKALPDDGVTAPNYAGAVLMLILILLVKQFFCESVGEKSLISRCTLRLWKKKIKTPFTTKLELHSRKKLATCYVWSIAFVWC
jgi:hypothetical protein